jgi:TnsA endonuclease N terminal.
MKIFLSGQVKNFLLNMSLLLIIGFIVTIPDFLIKVKESTGEIKTYVIEVKPKKQTRPPKKRKKVTPSYLYECKTYAVNTAKWKAAREFCNDRKIEFKIITEQELGIYHGR